MTGQPNSTAQQRGPSVGPVRVSGVRWARLHFGGVYHRWHVVGGMWAICGRQRFDHPDQQYSDARPGNGKLCKHCLAKLENALGVL